MEYTKTTATVSSVTTFSTCAIRSNSNSPPSATIFADTGCIVTNMAVIARLITANTPVQRRCESFSNRSSINIAQAANPRKISGHA